MIRAEGRIKWLSIPRVLGLLVVLIYHLFYGVLPGGFLGVDVFFTVSGYLITYGIIKEYSKSGGFDFLRFCKRRILRIWPPLILAIVFTLPFALLISPNFTVGIGKHISAAMGFVANYYEIINGGSYEAQLLPHLYIHTWSLAVEIHFYLLWAVFCGIVGTIITKILGRSPKFFAERTKKKTTEHTRIRAFKAVIFIFCVAAAAISYFCMRNAFRFGEDNSAAYFNTFYRMFPFLIGSAAAVFVDYNGAKKENFRSNSNTKANSKATTNLLITGHDVPRLRGGGSPSGEGGRISPASCPVATSGFPALREATTKSLKFAKGELAAVIIMLTAGVVGIVILTRFLKFGEQGVFDYGFLAASLLTAIVLRCGHLLHYRTPDKIDEPASVSIMSDISYNMYLYHWPLYIVFSSLLKVSVWAGIVTLLISLLFSMVMFYVVEPHIYGKKALTLKKIEKSENNGIPRLRAVGYASFALITVAAVFMGGMVLKKAPIITDIEEDFIIGYVTNDKDNVAKFKNWLAAVNINPVLFAEGFDEGLQNNGTDTNQDGNTTVPPVLRPPRNPTDVLSENVKDVTVIGDSVLLGARNVVSEMLPGSYVDAAGSRNFPGGYETFLELIERDSLSEYVVISLGTNNHPDAPQVTLDLIEALPSGHRLIFVTPFDGRSPTGGANSTAIRLRELPSQYPFVTIADWNLLMQTYSYLLSDDTVHMGGIESMELYADCIIEALNEAQGKPTK